MTPYLLHPRRRSPLHTRRRSLPALALCAAALSSLALAACGDSSDSSANGPKLAKATELKEPTSPVTLNYVGAAYPAKALEPVITAFENAHPNIKIKYQEIPQNQLNNVLSSRLDGSDIDVFDVDMPRVAAYDARGWLTDLTPTFGDLAGDIDKASLEASSIDGKLVGMPLQTSSQLLYYSKRLLKQAGVAFPAQDPDERMTWEDVEAAARKVQADGGAKTGLLFDQIDTYYQLQPLPMSAGGSAGAKGEGNLEPDITSPEWVKAMGWYGKLFADGVSPRGVTGPETPSLFASGEVAFYVGGPWWAPQFEAVKDLDFGVAPHPYFAGGKPYTPTGAWALGLNKHSNNVDAALIFMRFMGLDDGGFSQYISELAVPPANVQGTDKYYAGKVFQDPRMAGATDIIRYELENTATVRVKTVGYLEFEGIMIRTFDDIINGTPAERALGRASSELDAAWRKYR
jgi:ABC-type glycerol-3-phosphate transport system substrate-binding protein